MPARIQTVAKSKIKTLEKLYPQYDYSLAIYTGFDKSIIVRDKETGLCFEQNYNTHLKGTQLHNNFEYTFIVYYRKCLKKYNGRYHYSEYQGYNNPVKIYDTLLEREYYQNAQGHFDGKQPIEFSTNLSDFDFFLQKSKAVHGDEFEYLAYDWPNRKVTVRYKKTGVEYVQSVYEHSAGYFPRGCNLDSVSKGERIVRTIVEKKFNNEEIIYNSRPKWLNGLELDIYIPSLKFAIEFNGAVYHHSNFNHPTKRERELAKPKDYHYNKWKLCFNNGVKLLHLYDADLKDIENLIEMYYTIPHEYVEDKCFYLNKRGNLTSSQNPKALITYKPSFEFKQKYYVNWA